MAIIVSDTFDRADDPTSLGTADTGQTWITESGTWGIVSNTAEAITSINGFAVIETGTTSSITKVTVLNPNSDHAGGVICRWVDSSFFFSLTVDVFFGVIFQLRLKRIYGGSQSTVFDQNISDPSGGSIAIGTCGSTFDVYLNDALQGSYDDSIEPQNYGTKSGLRSFGNGATFDDFLVTTNGTCTPTYNCTESGCVDPGDGTGTYATLAECLDGCGVAVSYNCVDGTCIDPGDGSGMFSTLIECQQSGCGIPTTTGIGTERFDAGNGSSWYVVPQLSDSGEELRSKNIKAGYVVGKVTNASIQFYGFDINQEINPDEIAAGDRLPNSTTAQAIPDSDQVTQSPRKQVNIKNATNHTIRIAGDCTGEEIMDRIDQCSIEADIQGVRR